MYKLILILCLALFAGDYGDDDYFYFARMTDLYDGDTFTATINMGLGVFLHNQKIRILDIDAPEMRGDDKEAAMRSKNFTAMNLHNKQLTLCITGKGKYGRWLAHVNVDGVNFSQMMVDSGYAVWRKYK